MPMPVGAWQLYKSRRKPQLPFLPFPFHCLFWDTKPPVTGRRLISMSCHWSYENWNVFRRFPAKHLLTCSALSTSVIWEFLKELTCTIIMVRSWASRTMRSTSRQGSGRRMAAKDEALLSEIMGIIGLKETEWHLCRSGLRGVKPCFAALVGLVLPCFWEQNRWTRWVNST